MSKRWEAALPVVFIIVFSLFLFRDSFVAHTVPFPANLLVSYYEPWKSYPSPEYPNGPPNKAMGFDNLRIYFPLKTAAAEAVKQGFFPLWNPYNFSGTILHATYQSAIFHPLGWMFFILPTVDAWTTLIILQPILSAIAMYVFLGIMGFSRGPRLLGTVSYAFSGFFMTWWQESYLFTYSALFLPLALSAIEQYIRDKKGVWLALLSLSLAFSVFSGAFQMTFYVYAFSLLWIAYRLRKSADRVSVGVAFLLSYITSLLLAAIHLIPNIEAYGQSTRIATDVKYIFDAYLLPFQQLVTLFAPDYFGNPATYNYFGTGFYHERLMFLGVIPFMLIASQFFIKKQDEHHAFFRICFLITLSLVLSLPTTWLLLYYLKLPLLSTMTPSRMMMLVTFIGSVLTAYGAAAYRKGLPRKTLARVSGIVMLSVALAIGFPVLAKYVDRDNTAYAISLRNMVIPAVSFVFGLVALWGALRFPRMKRAGFGMLVGIELVTVVLFAKKYLYFSERRFVYPAVPVLQQLATKKYDRFWTYDNGYIEKNFATQFGLFSPEGYDSIIIRRYAEFLAYANSQGETTEPDRANALIRSTDHMDDILNDPYRARTLSLLGVRSIARKLVPDKNRQTIETDTAGLTKVWSDGTYAIYDYPQALPRVHLYSDVRTATDDATLLASLFAPTTDIYKTVFVEQSPDVLFDTSATGSATITAYHSHEVTVHTKTTGRMLLFLSDTYYPGWKVTLDEKPATLYRTNYTFRGVAVPEGTHTVTFTYQPLSFTVGVVGSVTGVILCGLLLLMKRSKKS